jgi:hypothetical protein
MKKPRKHPAKEERIRQRIYEAEQEAMREALKDLICDISADRIERGERCEELKARDIRNTKAFDRAFEDTTE